MASDLINSDTYTLPNGQVLSGVKGASESAVLKWAENEGLYRSVNYVKPAEGRDFVRATGQGLLFGFGDELGSGIAAGMAKLSGDKTPYSEIYKDILQQERKGVADFRENHPGKAYGTEILTSLPTAIAGGLRALQGVNKIAPSVVSGVPKWLAATTAGAVEGGVYGAGSANDSKAGGAALGAAGGAAGGSLGYVLINKIGVPAARALWRKISSSPKTDAERLLRQALQDTGLSPQEIQSQLNDLGPDAVLADLEGQLANLGRTAHSMPTGAARQKADNFLSARDLKQQATLWNKAKQLSNTSGDAFNSLKALEAAQKKAAAPFYRAAYSHEIMQTPLLRDLLELDDIKSAYKIGKRMAANEAGKKSSNQILVDDKFVDFPTMQEWDWIQRGLRAKAESAYNQEGGAAVGRSYRLLRDKLLKGDGGLDEINPEFAKARQIYAKGESLKSSVNIGKKFMSEDVDELDDLIDSFTDSEKQAYMIGAMNKIRDELLRPGETRDITKIPLFQSPMIRQRLETVFGKDKAGELLEEAGKLAQKRRTKNMMMSRSTTADMLAGQNNTLAFDAMQMMNSAAGDPAAAFGMLGRLTQPPKLSAETATILGNKLFTPGVDVLSMFPRQVAPPNQFTGILPSVAVGQQTGGILNK